MVCRQACFFEISACRASHAHSDAKLERSKIAPPRLLGSFAQKCFDDGRLYVTLATEHRGFVMKNPSDEAERILTSACCTYNRKQSVQPVDLSTNAIYTLQGAPKKLVRATADIQPQQVKQGTHERLSEDLGSRELVQRSVKVSDVNADDVDDSRWISAVVARTHE